MIGRGVDMKIKKRNKINFLLGMFIFIFSMFVLYEFIQSISSSLLFLSGLILLVLGRKLLKQAQKECYIIGGVMIALALLQTISAWVVLVLMIIIIAGKNPSLFNVVRDALFKRDQTTADSQFISVKLDQQRERPIKRIRKNWFGEEKNDDDIYEWEDINYTKVAGTSVIDLGNTIVPKGDNTVLIRKGFGNVKILVPEEVAVSLDISVFLGRVCIGEDELTLNNEVIKYRADRYDHASRRLKVVTNILVGQVEVIFI